MKLDPEPRLRGVDPSVMDWARAVVRALNLVSGFFSSSNILSIANGGTGANTAAGARNALGAQLEPGIVGYTAASSPPAGWLKRNGAAVSRTTYAALFAAIGTTYGAGDGSTTFNLPEGRGDFDRGWDDGRGVDAGRVLGSFQAGSGIWTDSIGDSTVRQVNGSTGIDNGEDVYFITRSQAYASGTYLASATSQRMVRTRPRNNALMAIIKY